MTPTTAYLVFSIVPSALCASESLHVADSLTRRDGAHAQSAASLDAISLHSGSKAKADSDRGTGEDQVHEKANVIVRKKAADVSKATKEMTTSEQTGSDATGEADDSTHSINHAREPSMLAEKRASARRHSGMAREQLTQKHHTEHSRSTKHHAKQSRNMARKYPQNSGKDERNVMEVLPSGEVESLREADVLDDTPSAQTVEASQKVSGEILQPTVAPTAVAAAAAQPSAVAGTGVPAAAAVPALPVAAAGAPAAAAVPALPVAAAGPPVAAAAPASPVAVTAPTVGYMPAAGYVPTQAQQVQGQPVAGAPGAAAPATANTQESSSGGVTIACFVLLILLIVISLAICGLSRVIAQRRRQEPRDAMLDLTKDADDRPATRPVRGSFAARRLDKKNSLVARPGQAATNKGDLSQKSTVDSDGDVSKRNDALPASASVDSAEPKRLSRYSLIKKNRSTENGMDSARQPLCSRNDEDEEDMKQTHSLPARPKASAKTPERTDEAPEEVGHVF